MPATSTPQEQSIHIHDVSDIRNCGQLRDRIAECLNNKRPLILDVSTFQSGDITFVQTLISAAKTAETWGIRMEIMNAPPAFAELFERCGLGARLRAPPFPAPRTQ